MSLSEILKLLSQFNIIATDNLGAQIHLFDDCSGTVSDEKQVYFEFNNEEELIQGLYEVILEADAD